VGNRYREAQEAFDRGRRLREEGRDDDGLLDPGRPIDLEASLCRDQRRFAEAVKLHDRALAVSRPDQIAVILLNKAYTLEEKGDHEASLGVLAEAARQIDGQSQPRLLFGVRFNFAGNLLRLGKAEEAKPILAEVRALAERLGNELDLIRTRWIEANVSVALGQRGEALEGLEEVRRAFVKHELPFDYALASLDLALLHLEEGRLVEVQEVAVEMVEIFKKLGVEREAIAAALLFQDAARRAAVTTDLVERLQEHFKKARGNPALRFEG
jgi:tetratricopeptide (TPR) repeat protein